ncbi:MAG: hypothetical protein IKO41_15865 [Lachnospiraceae bacterium]|nr:hypothetical protein [Lachnospiraceae bacterium]
MAGKILASSFLVLALFVLCGCSDRLEPTEANFEDAIQDYLDHVFPLRIFEYDFPVAAREDGPELPVFRALENCGLLTETEVRERDATESKYSQRIIRVNVHFFALSDKGKKWYFPDQTGRAKSQGYLGFGRGEVVGITKQTVYELDGRTMARVTFQLRITDIPEWTRDARISNALKHMPEIQRRIADFSGPNIIQKTVNLMQTPKGWIVNTGSLYF